MKKFLVLSVLLAGCATSSDTTGRLAARARFIDANGRAAGEATIYEVPDGVRVVANFPGLQGEHGFHFHAVGQCNAPGFESAGAHFNPLNRKHGRQNPAGPHAGDLLNVSGPNADFLVQTVTLTGANGLLDGDGAALVLHAAADDHRTDPSGNSGARIRCGVLERP